VPPRRPSPRRPAPLALTRRRHQNAFCLVVD
jgi:hypothetical protein